MDQAIVPGGDRNGAVPPRPVATFAGQATGLVIPRLSPAIRREAHYENKTGTLIRELVAAGGLSPTDKLSFAGEGCSPTDKLSFAGEGCSRTSDPTYNAAEQGIEKLLMRPAMEEFYDSIRCYEHDHGEFHIDCHVGLYGPTNLAPLIAFIRASRPFELEGEPALHLRWLGWLLNSHEVICHPDVVWPHWIKNMLDPGHYDHEQDEWHEMEDGPERDKRMKELTGQWNALKRDHSYLFEGHNMSPHTDEVLAVYRKMDPELADILGRMCATRDNPERGKLNFSEPIQRYDWGQGHVLAHCIDHIQYNLSQGNMEITDPFFDMGCRVSEISKLADIFQAICQPVFDLNGYIHGLDKGGKK